MIQKFLTIIIAILIIYSIITNGNFGSIKPSSNPQSTNTKQENGINLEGTWLEKSISKIMINLIKTPEGEKFIQHLIQPATQIPNNKLEFKMNSSDLIKSMFNIKIIKPGFGPEVVCGDKVSISYSIYDLSGNLIDEKAKIMTIGEDTEDFSIGNCIIGMRPGEIRETVVYPQAIKNQKQQHALKLKIKLDKIETSQNINNKIKIYDNMLAFTKPILCGEKIKFDLNISDISGNNIWSGKDLTVRVGDKSLPMALTHGLYNKTASSIRTIIVQGKYLQGELIKGTKLTKEHYYIAEIKNTIIPSE